MRTRANGCTHLHVFDKGAQRVAVVLDVSHRHGEVKRQHANLGENNVDTIDEAMKGGYD